MHADRPQAVYGLLVLLVAVVFLLLRNGASHDGGVTVDVSDLSSTEAAIVDRVVRAVTAQQAAERTRINAYIDAAVAAAVAKQSSVANTGGAGGAGNTGGASSVDTAMLSRFADMERETERVATSVNAMQKSLDAAVNILDSVTSESVSSDAGDAASTKPAPTAEAAEAAAPAAAAAPSAATLATEARVNELIEVALMGGTRTAMDATMAASNDGDVAAAHPVWQQALLDSAATTARVVVDKATAKMEVALAHELTTALSAAERDGSARLPAVADVSDVDMQAWADALFQHQTAAAQRLIDASIAVFAADKTGLRDYAAGSAVVAHSPTYRERAAAGARGAASGLFATLSGVAGYYTPRPAAEALSADVSLGACWAMRGAHGFLVIELPTAVRPTHVSVEHVSPRVAADATTAPHRMRVAGVNAGDVVDDAAFQSAQGVYLGEVAYQLRGPQVQMFSLAAPADGDTYTHVRFDVLSNHGNDEYTCIYKIRVHSVTDDVASSTDSGSIKSSAADTLAAAGVMKGRGSAASRP
jgi:SUN domain-containing protein 1/2